MPMYWDAYLADTTHLTIEEHGAYLLLLGAMWRRNGSVPDDDRDNARILGISAQKWRKIKARLTNTISGFHADGDTITQEKLKKVWENTQEKIEKNRANGAKGGRPKTKENNELAKANGSVSHNPNKTIPEPEPEPYEEAKASSIPRKRGSRLSEDWVLPKDWGDWALGEGWTEPTVRLEAEKFRDFWISKSGRDAAKLDWQATWRNWMRNTAKGKINGRKQDGSAADLARRAGERFAARRVDSGPGDDPSQPLLPARQSGGSAGSGH